MRLLRLAPRGRIAAFAIAGFVAASLGALCPARTCADTDPWAKGAQWMSVRAGYAKSTAKTAADGNLGFGMGYTRMLNAKWAASGFGHLEVLGRYRAAAEIEVPWTLELTRHFKWSTQFRPYVGAGAGIFYHKFYRSGADAASFRGGGYGVVGGNVPISDHSMLGLDVRAILEADEELNNPVFGEPNGHVSNGTRWSIKINYSRVY